MLSKPSIDTLIESKKSSKKYNSFVCVFGIYDVEFPSGIIINGKQYRHRAYQVWRNMILRCYMPPNDQVARNYSGCTICDEWMSFRNFLSFWKKHYHDGWQLDKDLLYTGNKVYSPERCVFVPRELNNFILDSAYTRGDFHQGVSWNKKRNKYQAQIQVNGRIKFLGRFDTPSKAHLAWHNKKLELAADWKETCDEIHPRLFSGLMSKVRMMRERNYNNQQVATGRLFYNQNPSSGG